MPTRSLVRAFITLYVTVGAVVLIQSLHTVLDAWRGEAFTGGRLHALVVGGFEIAGALLFLVPRTMRIGALGLLVVLLGGFALHALHGDLLWPLLVYAAAVWFVRAHGLKWGRTQEAD